MKRHRSIDIIWHPKYDSWYFFLCNDILERLDEVVRPDSIFPEGKKTYWVGKSRFTCSIVDSKIIHDR